MIPSTPSKLIAIACVAVAALIAGKWAVSYFTPAPVPEIIEHPIDLPDLAPRPPEPVKKSPPKKKASAKKRCIPITVEKLEAETRAKNEGVLSSIPQRSQYPVCGQSIGGKCYNFGSRFNER